MRELKIEQINWDLVNEESDILPGEIKFLYEKINSCVKNKNTHMEYLSHGDHVLLSYTFETKTINILVLMWYKIEMTHFGLGTFAANQNDNASLKVKLLPFFKHALNWDAETIEITYYTTTDKILEHSGENNKYEQ